MATQYRLRIQNALAALAAVADMFFPVTYNVSTGVATKGASAVEPVAVHTNELRSEFEDTRVSKSTFARERTSWLFNLVVSFNQEVTGEDFESAVSASPPYVARDSDHSQQIRLLLQNSNYEHPPQQDPESGSRLTFTFEAQLSPI